MAENKLAHFAYSDVGFLVRPALADIVRIAHPTMPVNDLGWLRAGPTILVNARWVPPAEPATDVNTYCVATIGDEIAYAVLGPDRLTYCSLNTLEDCLETWKQSARRRPARGRMVSYLWDLVHDNAAQLCRDFQPGPDRQFSCPDAAAVIGPRHMVRVHRTARIEPMVAIDTTGGPVLVDADAVVTAFSRLEGPCAIGPGTHVLGAKIRAGTTLGPSCRIGGEVEASIVQSFTNKYHDGFLGHSYVGEWVNLGAGTSNSDLRNDYGEVSVVVAGRRVPTAKSKIGCFIGDHVKTGLGTLLNTGSSIGPFANLLPSGNLLPKHIPPFASWWNGALEDRADLPRLLETAAAVMARRGAQFTEAHADLYRGLFEETAPARRQALREAGQRRLRRIA